MMKKLLFTFATGAFLATGAIAQSNLHNLNLETWAGNECSGWGTLNSYMAFGAPQTVFEETTDPGEGLSSAKISTEYWLGATSLGASSDTVSGFLTLGGPITGAIGLPCTTTPDSMSFMFKGEVVSGDTALILVSLSVYDTAQNTFAQGMLLVYDSGAVFLDAFGQQLSQITTNNGAWNSVTIPIWDFSFGAATPDTLQIICASSSGSLFGSPLPLIGSTIYVDNFFVPYFSSVGERDEDVKFSVYPNPSSDYFVIKNGSSKSDMDVQMIDINGKFVRSYTDVSGGEMTIDGNGLARGAYFIKVTSGGKQVIKQVVFE